MKRTLKREFKEFEIVEMELIQPKVAGVMSRGHWRRRGAGSGKCAHGGIGINWGWATRARGAKNQPRPGSAGAIPQTNQPGRPRDHPERQPRLYKNNIQAVLKTTTAPGPLGPPGISAGFKNGAGCARNGRARPPRLAGAPGTEMGSLAAAFRRESADTAQIALGRIDPS